MRSVKKRSADDLRNYEETENSMDRMMISECEAYAPDVQGVQMNLSAPALEDVEDQGFAFSGGMVANCLTRELRNLPSGGQATVTQDIYGISSPHVESFPPEVFAELERQIALIPEKEAYLIAEDQSHEYVHDPAFQILFLRATLGDVKKAAKRLVRHFKTKLDLFGAEKLVKHITLDDFDEDDMETLRSGGFQVLKKRDRAGRSVLFGRYTAFRYSDPKQILRTLWYIWMTLLEDENNQIKGVTAIGYENGRNPLERYDHSGEFHFEMPSHDHGGFDRNLAKQITTIPLSVPVRPMGYHLCTDSDQWVATLNMVVATICKFMRLRMKLHHGSHQECKYQLMTHGMPADVIPVTEDGMVDLKDHHDWIQQRRIIESRR